MYILFPGRHHLNTRFQHDYLKSIINNGITSVKNVFNEDFEDEKITGIIFAVTSANHSNTRRNPLAFYLRAMSIQRFAGDLDVPVYIYGIDDVGHLSNFAEYTVKRIEHESEYMIDLTTDNCVVLCSTPVLDMYRKLGFKILGAELSDYQNWKHSEILPFEIVELIAKDGNNWYNHDVVKNNMHEASIEIYKTYNLASKIRTLFNDDMIGDDGDITDTRDYNTYVRQMDDIAMIKYLETKPFIKPGRIGDIGCAVGSWIKLACKNEKLRESDFFGIEIARKLYDICVQRKNNGEFPNPFVFFSRKNAVTGLCFEKNSMDTVHTSSLTHEIESYGSRVDLLDFIKNRYDELVMGGVWINRDVVGPENSKSQVYLKLNKNDGENTGWDFKTDDNDELNERLSKLSTYARFFRFANDFRKHVGYNVDFTIEKYHGTDFIKTSLFNACEYLSKKDYTDNWNSEMHETFCFWSFEDWKNNVKKAGFKLLPGSRAYANPWIVSNRFMGKAWLYEKKGAELVSMKFPVTNMILILEKNI